jgi:hypoxanthine phosphoribosyltransferase
MVSDPYNILFTSTQIEDWQTSMGHRINQFHKNDPLPSTAVCVLAGGYHVFSGITRYMAFDLDLDFCKVESYQGTEKSSNSVLQRFKDKDGFDLPIKLNQRIYVFDDVIDTGETAKLIAEYYESNFMPAELILCTVVNKNKQAVEELKQYYSHIWYGFEVENEWLVGYGMDNPQGFMRQSPSILKMKKND